MEARDKAIVPITPSVDHSTFDGYFVTITAGEAVICANGTTAPFGVVTDGDDTAGKDAVAVCGGNAGPLRVKAAATPGTIVLGSELVLDGTTLGAVKLYPATGARVNVGVALESAAAGELFMAVIRTPVVYTA
jgi:hypothetical protein